MQLQDQHINDFIELYKKHFGVVLSRAQAEEKGMQLCNFVRLVSFSQDNAKEDKD
jgi:hypothetical protein